MAEAAVELREILEAAERAAATEDFASAERHLRQAAELQEVLLGPAHHDLANTLNNLGIVCEHVGKSADAEGFYRRAYRIASTSLPADHPLVQTSGQNLRDFCAAVGKPFELRERQSPELDAFAPESSPAKTRAPEPPAPQRPKPTPVSTPAPAPRMPPVPIAARPPAPQPTKTMRTASPVTPPSSRPNAAIAIGVVLVLGLAAYWFGFREPPSSTAPTESRVDAPAPREEPVAPREEPVVPREEPASPATKAAPEPPVVAAPARPAVTETRETPRPAAAGTSGDVSVAEAKVCRPLSTSNWTCTPATNPAAPGVFFFYTRLKSPRDSTVQHRWLMNGRLLRSVSLRVGANTGAGYRTYSRNTVSAERRGEWTIELRDAGGALLHEERFTVQ